MSGAAYFNGNVTQTVFGAAQYRLGGGPREKPSSARSAGREARECRWSSRGLCVAGGEPERGRGVGAWALRRKACSRFDGGSRCALPPYMLRRGSSSVRWAMYPERLSPAASASTSRRLSTRRGSVMFTRSIVSSSSARVNSDDAENPAGVFGRLTDGFDARGWRNGLGLARPGRHRPMRRRLPRRPPWLHPACRQPEKHPGQVRHHHAERSGVRSGFDSDGIMHGCLLQTGLLANRRDQPAAQVLFGVRPHDNAGASWVFENMMRAAHTIQQPPGLLQFPNDARAVHSCA